MSGADQKVMRADARRNYERLLTEAKQAFSSQGTDASLEEIARRAGVGIGTLYRHFPTREALLETLLRDRFDAQAAYAAELLEDPDPLAALQAWSTRFVETSSVYRGLAETLADALAEEASLLHRSCLGMRENVRALVSRAHAAGVLAADVSLLEVLLVINSAAWAAERSPAGGPSAGRLVSLAFAGLRAR